jgi:hypothetical protein
MSTHTSSHFQSESERTGELVELQELERENGKKGMNSKSKCGNQKEKQRIIQT